jgi:hypothetical protein
MVAEPGSASTTMDPEITRAFQQHAQHIEQLMSQVAAQQKEIESQRALIGNMQAHHTPVGARSNGFDMANNKKMIKLEPYEDNGKITFHEFKFKLLNFLSSFHKDIRETLLDVEGVKTEISSRTIEEQATKGLVDFDIEWLSIEIYDVLSYLLKGHPLTLLQNVPHGNGLEAWRQLNKEYDAQTPQSNKKLLESIIRPGPCKQMSKLSSRIQQWMQAVKQHDMRHKSQLDEDIKMCAFSGMLPEELQERIKTNGSNIGTFQALYDYVSG